MRRHREVTWRMGRTLLGAEGLLPLRPVGLVIGECPGANTDSRMPMFPHPPSSAAGRLMQFGGLTPTEYLSRLERVNQCELVWNSHEATSRRRLILEWLDEQTATGPEIRVLLLGRRVQSVWGVKSESGFGVQMAHGRRVAFVMHPSGLSRVYNDELNRQIAGSYLRWCAGLEQHAE